MDNGCSNMRIAKIQNITADIYIFDGIILFVSMECFGVLYNWDIVVVDK